MPDAGDTKLKVVIGIDQIVVPDDNDTDVSILLAQVTCTTKVWEYVTTGAPEGWYSGAWAAPVSYDSLAVQMSGGISMAAPSGQNVFLSTFILTSLLNGALQYDTEYTWYFTTVQLTHGTWIGGPHGGGNIQRTYATVPVSFTTESSPGSPKVGNVSPADAAGNITLRPTLTWEVV